jgi:hypothetical protein
MLDTTATGQAEIARYLREIAETGEASVAHAHLPAAMPSAALFACAVPSYGYSTDDFFGRAFDASTLGDGKAGIVCAADDDEDNERDKNGGKLKKEILSDMLDAQEEYLQEWMKGTSTIAGLTLSNAEHHELAQRLKNDEQFRTLVIAQMLQDNPNLSKEQAERAVSAYEELIDLKSKPPSKLTDAEKARITTLENVDGLKQALETSQTLNQEYGKSINQSYAATIENSVQQDKEFLSQSNQPSATAAPAPPNNGSKAPQPFADI